MPRSPNYTSTQSYRYMLTAFTAFVHSRGGHHHPFPGCGGSPGHTPLLQEMRLPQLCLSPCCSPNPTATPAIGAALREVSLHPKAGYLHAAPCQQGQTPPMADPAFALSLPTSHMSILPLSYSSGRLFLCNSLVIFQSCWWPSSSLTRSGWGKCPTREFCVLFHTNTQTKNSHSISYLKKCSYPGHPPKERWVSTCKANSHLVNR